MLEDNRPDFVQGVKKDDHWRTAIWLHPAADRPIIIKLAGVGAVRQVLRPDLLPQRHQQRHAAGQCDTDRIDEGDRLFVDLKNRVIKRSTTGL